MIDVKQIMQLIPHRYPLLLVDRVLEIDPGKSIKAIKCVTINESFFNGHFPGEPIMPGVLIIEALAQAGGILALYSEEKTFSENRLLLFRGIEKAKFRRTVVPGDRLELNATMLKKKRNFVTLATKAIVDGEIATEAEVSAFVSEE
ncbi:MAG: 3-hydroxyacyl-[acyl-carrier-protein] dehydratase FabZ [Deltaproteobacteria bacterium]|nr:MAG: 3-hydroxyacyl-[acyl-carrier-protein] dehydratase FabZ [Deltaproteobacteria bacterium]